MRRILPVLAALLLLAAPAAGHDFDKALEAAERGDFAVALREWRPLAEQGNAKAQYNLGLMYDNGLGVPQDYAEAGKWYRLAAAQGDAEAQYNLGLMYYKGEGVRQDYAEAVKWSRLAAAQGNAKAQYNLGLMYENGLGVPKDYVQAHMWFNLAAAQGEALASNSRDFVAEKMIPDDVSKAQSLAHEWLEAHPQ